MDEGRRSVAVVACRWLRTVVGVAALSLAATTAAAECPPTAQDLRRDAGVQGRIALLEAWLEAQMAHEGWPGVALGIVVDQQLVWGRGFGYTSVSNRTPVDLDTLFLIASNTKMFTAIGALKLHQERKLRVDDPLSKHLRWARIFSEEEPTLRDLLTHSSGLQREVPGTSFSERSYPSKQQMAAQLSREAVTARPGTQWKYSNLAIAMLGEVVATTSGRPYEDYLVDSVLRPIGMKRTTFSPPADAIVAQGHSRRVADGPRRELPKAELGALAPAAGLWSSVNDLSQFAAWQFRVLAGKDRQVLSEPTLRSMQRVHWVDPGWTFGLGLGFIIYHDAPHDLVGHGGDLNGQKTDFTISPKDKIAVITLANAEDIKVFPDQPGSVSRRVFSWVVPAIREAASCRSAVKADETLTLYVGKYRDGFGDRVVLVVDGALVMADPLAPLDEAERLTRLVPVAPSRFRVESDNGFDDFAPGEILTFERNDSDEVVGFHVAGRKLVRVDSWANAPVQTALMR